MQFILSLSFTLVAVIAIVGITVFYSRQFDVSSQRIAENNSVNVIDQVNINLDNYMRDFMKLSDTAYYNILKVADISRDRGTIENELQLLLDTNENSLLSIALFDKNGNLIAGQAGMQVKEGVDPTSKEWFVNAGKQIEILHISEPYVDDIFMPVNGTYNWVISLSRSVEINYNGDVQRGVLLVYSKFSEIERITKSASLGGSGYAYVLSDNGATIFHPKQQLIDAGLMREDFNKVLEYSDGIHREDYDGTSRLITTKTMGYTGWKIVGVSSVSEMQTSPFDNRLLIWGLSLLVCIFLVGINFFISSKITTPLRRLDRAISAIEGDLDAVRIPIEGTYEIQHLGKTLNSMTASLKALMDDVVYEQEHVRRSEMIALQSQINPHFLYNTLDSAVWMIEAERYDGAITMITSLARLFRISLSQGDNIISLEKELEHVENYLTIQQMRYKNKFDYKITYDERLKDIPVIKLIVQPLVENAIYHAMEYVYDDGEIHVKAYVSEDILSIDVIDNGPGMTETQVKDLQDGVHKVDKTRGSGVGFQNVLQRVQMYYGEPFGLDVISEPDEGTTIRIRIPVTGKGKEGVHA
jgi:two-component system sensor histidine kinase YesM